MTRHVESAKLILLRNYIYYVVADQATGGNKKFIFLLSISRSRWWKRTVGEKRKKKNLPRTHGTTWSAKDAPLFRQENCCHAYWVDRIRPEANPLPTSILSAMLALLPLTWWPVTGHTQNRISSSACLQNCFLNDLASIQLYFNLLAQ